MGRGGFLGSVVIRELDVREFRGIRRLTKPLELGGFNVLIGRNNVGKTAILEALYLFAIPYTAYYLPPYGKKVIEFIAEAHGGTPSLIYGYSGTAVLRYLLNDVVKVRVFRGGEVSVSSVQVRIDRDGSVKASFDSVEVRGEDYVNLLKSLGAGLGRSVVALYVPNNSEAFSKLYSYIMRGEVLSWIEKTGVHRRVVREILTQAIYDRFTEVIVKGRELCVRKEVSEELGPLYVNVNSLGEGVRRVLLTYLVTEYLRPKIFLWDDIEVAAHPTLLESTIKWLAESGMQVVISTHSIDVLYALTQVRPKDCKVIALRKNQEDIVNYQTLTLDKLEEYLRTATDIRKIVDELEL